MSGKSGNEQVVEVDVGYDQIEAVVVTSATPAESGAGGSSGSTMAGVVEDRRWHVEEYLDCCGKTLDGRRFKAMAMEGYSLFIYDRDRIRHDTSIGAWRRRRGVCTRNWSLMLTEAPLADMPFVRCEEEVAYSVQLREVMVGAATRELPEAVYLSPWFFEKPFLKLPLFHGGRLRTPVLELELWQRAVAQNPLLIGWHNVEVFAVFPAKRQKYYLIVPDNWLVWEPPNKLCVPAPPVLSYLFGEILKKTRVGLLAMPIAETEFVISTFVCFFRCAQYGLPPAFMFSCMRAVRHDHGFILP